jgi:hypothetical protein
MGFIETEMETEDREHRKPSRSSASASASLCLLLLCFLISAPFLLFLLRSALRHISKRAAQLPFRLAKGIRV